jgi:hypothetical protein
LRKHTACNDDGRMGEKRYNVQQTDGVCVMYMLHPKCRHDTLYNTKSATRAFRDGPVWELKDTIVPSAWQYKQQRKQPSSNSQTGIHCCLHRCQHGSGSWHTSLCNQSYQREYHEYIHVQCPHGERTGFGFPLSVFFLVPTMPMIMLMLTIMTMPMTTN